MTEPIGYVVVNYDGNGKPYLDWDGHIHDRAPAEEELRVAREDGGRYDVCEVRVVPEVDAPRHNFGA
jgi:hypothetical protein